MPGPALSSTFTYTGTPDVGSLSAPATTLDREVVQSNRFFQNIQIGTHSRTPASVHIPQNSDLGKGVSSGGVVNEQKNTESDAPYLRPSTVVLL